MFIIIAPCLNPNVCDVSMAANKKPVFTRRRKTEYTTCGGCKKAAYQGPNIDYCGCIIIRTVSCYNNFYDCLFSSNVSNTQLHLFSQSTMKLVYHTLCKCVSFRQPKIKKIYWKSNKPFFTIWTTSGQHIYNNSIYVPKIPSDISSNSQTSKEGGWHTQVAFLPCLPALIKSNNFSTP